MLDVLLPESDGAVAAQLVAIAVITAVALVAARRNRDLRILIVGIAVLVVGLMAVRAIH